MLGHARGMKCCLEGMKATGKNIPQKDIDTYAVQEKHYDGEVKRLDVGVLPEEDLFLSPLMVESKFVIQEILDRVDKYGSNMDLIDSEAAIALRTPLREQGDQSEGPSKSLLETVQSPVGSEVPLPERETASKDPAAIHEKTIEPTPEVPASSTPAKVVFVTDSSSLELTDLTREENVPRPVPKKRIRSRLLTKIKSRAQVFLRSQLTVCQTRALRRRIPLRQDSYSCLLFVEV